MEKEHYALDERENANSDKLAKSTGTGFSDKPEVIGRPITRFAI